VRHGELRVPRADAEPDAPAEGAGSLRLLVDQFPAVFWTTDAELRFTSSLGAGLAELGLGPNQLVGMTLQDFFESDQGEPAAAHRRGLEGRSVTFLMHWGGRTFHAHIAPLRDGQGRIIGTICIAVDLKGSDRSASRRGPGGEGHPLPLHHEAWRFIAPG
jgi:PAS domain-containing protein